MRRALALVVALHVGSALAAFDPAAMRQKYVVGATYHTMGFSGTEVRNIDRLAGDELLIGYSNMWQLLRWDNQSGDFVQVGFFENDYGGIFGGGGVVSVRLAQFDPHGPVQVVALGELDQIGVFELDGSLRTPLWEPPLQNIARMRVADLDGQPGDEILLQTAGELTAWKFGASAPLWRIPAKYESILIAQLDTDPQWEIAFASGTVIDTKTLQTQWRYPIGFGYAMATVDVNGDGVPDLIGCRNNLCDALDVLHQTNLWETFLNGAVGIITAAEVDGRPMIFEADGQHGVVSKIDGRTGTVLQQFDKQGGGNFVVVGDLRGDCSKQLIWGKDGDSTALDTFHVTDATTMKTLWSSVPEEDGSSGIVVADFSGTGHLSVLWSNGGGSVERFVTFSPPARAYRTVPGYFTVGALYLGVSAAAQLDSDPAMEYVLPVTIAGNLNDSIGIYDGATHRLQWSVPVIHPSDTLTSMTAGDLNGDGVADIVVGSGILYFPRSHNEVVAAVDGKTRTVLWQTKERLSHLLDEHCGGCVTQVKIADLDLDGSKDVLSVVPSDGLYAFNGQTGAMLWHSLVGIADDVFDTKAVAVTVADIDPSPGAEIIALMADRRIAVLDSSAGKIIRTKDLAAYGAGTAVEVADLDGDGTAEIVVLAEGGLMVLSADKLDVLWRGGFILPLYSLGNQIAIADVDGDATPEIVVSSAHSLRVFEYRPSKADVTPPLFGNAAIRPLASTGCCRVAFEWDAAADAESMPVRYRIYKSAVPDVAASSLIAETSDRAFVDHSLLAARTYFYAVTAVDSKGNESTQALRISAVAPGACPARRHAAQMP